MLHLEEDVYHKPISQPIHQAALALFLCNSLVLVTFIYRLRHRSNVDLEYSMADGSDSVIDSNAVEFTSIIDLPSKFSSHALTSGAQSKGDGACTKALTLGTSDAAE